MYVPQLVDWRTGPSDSVFIVLAVWCVRRVRRVRVDAIEQYSCDDTLLTVFCEYCISKVMCCKCSFNVMNSLDNLMLLIDR
jgi:hypothetical protein